MITAKYCIYRDINQNNGICCKCPCTLSSDFCIKHIHIKNPIYNYIMKQNPQSIHSGVFLIDIIKVYFYMYISNVEDRERLITAFIKNKTKLYNIGIQLGMKIIGRYSKRKVLACIIDKLEWHCFICKLSRTNRIIGKLQRAWKKYMSKITGSVLGEPLNEFEIFTFDNVLDIEHPFYILDDRHVYCFDCMNLYYHIKTNGSLNPYTKNTISETTINRMYHYMFIKDLCFDDEYYRWQSTINAYTDVSIKLDSLGYYTDIRWYTELDYDTLINILNTYHTYVSDSTYMCCENFEDIYPEYVYKFCNMVLEMLDDEDASTYGFILYKALVENSDIFGSNSPDWILS